MLDIHWLRNHLDEAAERLARRGFELDRSRFLELDGRRKALQTEVQALQSARNRSSKAIGRAKGRGEDAGELLAEMGRLAERLKAGEAALRAVQAELEAFLAGIPNLPHPTVPVGRDESDNVEIHRRGAPPEIEGGARDHVALGEALGQLDLGAAARIAGARFAVLKGPLARLQRALIHFMLDLHTREHGYQEVYVPYLAAPHCLFGTGQLPKFEADLFKVGGEPPRYLIPTAEVPVTNLVREAVLEAEELPLKWVAHTPCFRSEAGSYGKDTRGLIRQHQFEKVELVQIVQPEGSYDALEELTAHAEVVLERLELPFRRVALCTGDLGFASAKTYDLEVWMPGQGRYREISSCSHFEAFQARRMQARYRPAGGGRPEPLHTLNGSGVAVGRCLAALMENHQLPGGDVRIPPALKPYLGGADTLLSS